MPLLRKKRQSASFWFQRDSVESASAAGASARPSSTMEMCSVSAIAHLVFGGLAEARHRTRDPVRGPGDQLRGIDDRPAEQSLRLRGVGEPGGGFFLARYHRSAAETLAEPCGEIAHGQNFVA